MSEEALSALTQLRDALHADVGLARTREEHIRVSARAHEADRLLAIVTDFRTGTLIEQVSEPVYSLTETSQAANPGN